MEIMKYAPIVISVLAVSMALFNSLFFNKRAREKLEKEINKNERLSQSLKAKSMNFDSLLKSIYNSGAEVKNGFYIVTTSFEIKEQVSFTVRRQFISTFYDGTKYYRYLLMPAREEKNLFVGTSEECVAFIKKTKSNLDSGGIQMEKELREKLEMLEKNKSGEVELLKWEDHYNDIEFFTEPEDIISISAPNTTEIYVEMIAPIDFNFGRGKVFEKGTVVPCMVVDEHVDIASIEKDGGEE